MSLTDLSQDGGMNRQEAEALRYVFLSEDFYQLLPTPVEFKGRDKEQRYPVPI
jgi:hypothetical protein